MEYCRNCGAEIDENAAMCVKCGFNKGTGNNFCQHCGSPTKEGQNVCTSCGFSLKGAQKVFGISGKNNIDGVFSGMEKSYGINRWVGRVVMLFIPLWPIWLIIYIIACVATPIE